MKSITQRIACKAIIEFNSKILLLREAKTNPDGTNTGKYCMPGGRIEAGEPFMEGLKREVFEETGLEITVGAPVFVGEWFPEIRGEQNQIVAVFFACTTTDRDVRLNPEHDQYLWIDPATYQAYELMDPEDYVIQAFLDKRSK